MVCSTHWQTKLLNIVWLKKKKIRSLDRETAGCPWVTDPGGSSHADIVFPEGEFAVRKQIPFFHQMPPLPKKVTDF